jgi:cell division transport system permease protein
MRLVGATDGFIRRPFLLDGLIKGALGGLAAIGLNYAAYEAVNQMFSARFFDAQQALLLVVFGTGLGLLASALSVSRHLGRVQQA